MDYAKIAAQVIELVGGKDNIRSAAHCATRLRLQLKNNELRNEEALTDVEGVKGVFLTQSQFQIGVRFQKHLKTQQTPCRQSGKCARSR